MLTPEQVAKYVRATGNTRLKKLEICWFVAEAPDEPFSKSSQSKFVVATSEDTDEYAKELIERLRAYRLKKELSTRALAEAIGISESSLKGYFSRKRPRLPDLIKQDVIRRFLEASDR